MFFDHAVSHNVRIFKRKSGLHKQHRNIPIRGEKFRFVRPSENTSCNISINCVELELANVLGNRSNDDCNFAIIEDAARCRVRINT